MALTLRVRAATACDLPGIVALLADDALGAGRERAIDPLPTSYWKAFEAIAADPNNELVVAEDPDSRPIAVLQLTYTPYISHQGGWRATIENVRVVRHLQGKGIGRQFLTWAIDRARLHPCHMVQLTTDCLRPQARQFFESLGFVASLIGMKHSLMFDPRAQG